MLGKTCFCFQEPQLFVVFSYGHHCLTLDGFDLNTVHKLSSKDNLNSGLLGGKRECFLYATPPPIRPHLLGQNMDLLVLRVILLKAFLGAVVHGRQAQLDAFGTGESFGD